MPTPRTKTAVKPEPDPEDATPTPVVAPEPDPEPEPDTPAEGGHQLLNPGTSAVTYDADSHQAAPGEVVTVAEIDEVGQAALDRGYLIEK